MASEGRPPQTFRALLRPPVVIHLYDLMGLSCIAVIVRLPGAGAQPEAARAPRAWQALRAAWRAPQRPCGRPRPRRAGPSRHGRPASTPALAAGGASSRAGHPGCSCAAARQRRAPPPPRAAGLGCREGAARAPARVAKPRLGGLMPPPPVAMPAASAWPVTCISLPKPTSACSAGILGATCAAASALAWHHDCTWPLGSGLNRRGQASMAAWPPQRLCPPDAHDPWHAFIAASRSRGPEQWETRADQVVNVLQGHVGPCRRTLHRPDCSLMQPVTTHAPNRSVSWFETAVTK